MLVWKKEYNTGVKHLDEQHQKLFEIGNSAYELLNNSLVIDKYDKVISIIEELKNYSIFHFNSEEEYLLSIGYKKFLSHKVEHDDFIEKVNGLDFNVVDEGQNEYILNILEFVFKWITEHILGKDKDYSI
jgi:hemerythrin